MLANAIRCKCHRKFGKAFNKEIVFVFFLHFWSVSLLKQWLCFSFSKSFKIKQIKQFQTSLIIFLKVLKLKKQNIDHDLSSVLLLFFSFCNSIFSILFRSNSVWSYSVTKPMFLLFNVKQKFLSFENSSPIHKIAIKN